MKSKLIKIGLLAAVAALTFCLMGCAKADEKTQQVIDDINGIGEVTLDSEENIKLARKGYNALTKEQRAFVDNLSVLETAEDTLSNALVQQCIDAINVLNEMTLEKKPDLQTAKDLFNALSPDERERVTNKDILDEATTTLQTLEDEREAQKKAELLAPADENTSNNVRAALCGLTWYFMHGRVTGDVLFNQNDTYHLSFLSGPATQGHYEILNNYIKCQNDFNGDIAYIPYSWKDGKLQPDFAEGFIQRENQPE